MANVEPPYLTLVSHYEACLARHGDNYRGVDWPNAEGALLRYKVMLDLIPWPPQEKVRLLDFGCGASHLYSYIRDRGLDGLIDYSGLDLSEKFIALSRSKFPEVPYYRLDILTAGSDLPEFDYAVMNGVFTERRSMSNQEMFAFLKSVVAAVFAKTRRGLAFNVMSKQVEWERDDLFHLPMDELATFLSRSVSRRFVIHHDYGLYEYTTYVYR